MSASAAARRRTRVPAELSRYLAALFGPTAGALLDIRVRRGGAAMTQHFAPARGGLAGSLIVELGAGADVYLGVLPRRREHGGKDGLMRHGWPLWADCDTPQATAALEAFAPSPSLIVASGSPGHRHAYWLLRRPLELADVERANRRLAAALSADGGAVTNAATILRPPSTHNFKGDEPRPVRLLDAASLRRYRAAQIVGTLPISSRPAGKAAAAAHHALQTAARCLRSRRATTSASWSDASPTGPASCAARCTPTTPRRSVVRFRKTSKWASSRDQRSRVGGNDAAEPAAQRGHVARGRARSPTRAKARPRSEGGKRPRLPQRTHQGRV